MDVNHRNETTPEASANPRGQHRHATTAPDQDTTPGSCGNAIAQATAAGNVLALTKALRAAWRNRRENIPEELRNLPCWLGYETPKIDPKTGKIQKVPVRLDGRRRFGEQGSPDDLTGIGSWDEANSLFASNLKISGLGFAMLRVANLVALDFDHCVKQGEIDPAIAAITRSTYTEISPSGTGIRAFFTGQATDAKHHTAGIEIFCSKGFVTVTGDEVENSFSFIGELQAFDEIRADLDALIQRRGGKAKTEKATQPKTDRLGDAADGDPVLNKLRELGFFERDMGGGKFSVRCPFEDTHSDPGRNAGDGDTAYFLPHTNGYRQGHFVCLHSHCAERSQEDFLHAIGLGAVAEMGEWSEYPVPQPLPDSLPPVPAFDYTLLPQGLRAWVRDIAERMQVPPDIPAVGAVVSLASAIGRRVQIRPKQRDTWTVVPNLWGAVIAPPGWLKSPALGAAMQPLHRLEREAQEAFQAEYAAYEMNKQTVALQNSAAKSTGLSALKKNPDAELPELHAEPEAPTPTRYVVNNFSLEALGEVMLNNGNGVLAFQDEIYGLLKQADRPGNEELHSFLLTAWNGQDGFTFDRIGRGTRYVKHVCLSVLGGIQPGRLVDYLDEVTRGGQYDSGFLQRFQLMVWPDLPERWELIDREPDTDAINAAHRLFDRVIADPDFGEATIDIRRFDSSAQSLFYDWLSEIELEVRAGELPPVIASHLAKYKSLIPSLALVFAVADDVQGDIPQGYLKQAIEWGRYLRAHAERVFSVALHSELTHAKELLRRLQNGDVAGKTFTQRSIYRNHWRLLDRNGTEQAIACLLDYGWIIERQVKGPQGRATTEYMLTPLSESDIPF